MALTQAQVEHIAELAKLHLTEEEKARFCDQLSAILDYAEILTQVDTSAVAPTTTVFPLRTVLRADEIAPSMPRDRMLSNAPDAESGMFKVPAVLE